MRFLLPLTYMLGIYLLSSLPGDTSQAGGFIGLLTPQWQNALHIPLFAGLAFSWLFALKGIQQTLMIRALMAGIFSTLYGAADEWHQTMVPGRYGSITDLLLDALGASLVLSTVWWPRLGRFFS